MTLLYFLIGMLIAPVHAEQLQNVGTADPGVSAMWDMVCSVMPCLGGSIGWISDPKTAPFILAGIIIDFILKMIGGIAAGVLVYAGIKIILSQGKDEGVAEGKKIAMYALGGIVLAIISDGVVQFVIYLINLAAA